MAVTLGDIFGDQASTVPARELFCANPKAILDDEIGPCLSSDLRLFWAPEWEPLMAVPGLVARCGDCGQIMSTSDLILRAKEGAGFDDTGEKLHRSALAIFMPAAVRDLIDAQRSRAADDDPVERVAGPDDDPEGPA